MKPSPLLSGGIIALLSLILLAAGCASSSDASTPAGKKYTGGGLTAVEDASFDRVWRAGLAALNACDVTVLDTTRTATGGLMDGRTPDLKTVKVNVRRLSEDKAELRIKVDSFGNSELSHLIYDKFKIALGD